MAVAVISTTFIVQSTERHGGHHPVGELDVAGGMLACRGYGRSHENEQGLHL